MERKNVLSHGGIAIQVTLVDGWMTIRIYSLHTTLSQLIHTVYTELFARSKLSPITPICVIGENFFRISFMTTILLVSHFHQIFQCTMYGSTHPLLSGGYLVQLVGKLNLTKFLSQYKV